MRLFINRPHDNGCTYYRQTLPVRHLMSWCVQLGMKVTYSKRFDESVPCDAYLFSRFISSEYLPVMVDLKRRGKLLIWDLDDDLLTLERHSAKRQPVMALQIRSLMLCLELADIITVSTEALARRVGRPDKTLVLPNLIDLEHNPPQNPDDRRRGILFTGSPSHLDDLELIRDLYDQTKRGRPWYFYGARPKWLDRWGTYVPWSRVHEYPRVCRLFNAEFSLCPLQPCVFNDCKSAIKVWETAMIGADVVASNTGPYAGHPAAIVPPGEPFTLEHLERARGNCMTCQAIGMEHSWKLMRASGRQRWADFFAYLAHRLHGQQRESA